MKKIVTFLVVMMSIQLGYAGEVSKGFVCTNLAYRHAEVSYMAGEELSILDVKANGQEELRRILADSLKTESRNLQIDSLQLSIKAGPLECSAPSYVMVCRIEENKYKASGIITVKGRVSFDSGLETGYTLHLKVDLQKFDFSSALYSNPGIILNGKGKTVGLNRVKMMAKANVSLNGQPLELEWDMLFKLAKESDSLSSWCEKL